MKIRSLTVAMIVLAALVGTLYWSEHRKPADDTAKASADAPPLILKLDEASITKLELKKKDAAAIVLDRNSSGNWQITQPKPYGADQSTVTSALSTLSSLNSERLLEDHASDLKEYGLDQPSFEVDISEKDNKTQKLELGESTPTGSAVYAMLAGDPRVFTLATYNKTAIDKSLNDLRDKRLLAIDPDKISRIELVQKNQEIEFGRNKDDWQILKPKPLRADSVQVSELARKLTDARMDLGASDADAKNAASSYAHGAPVATAKLTDQAGTQELRVRKDKDTYYAKSSLVDGAYKVDADLGKALDKGLDDFRNKKLFDFGYNDPTKIEMHAESKAYYLSKSGTDWWSNGKKMDAESVQSFIAKLRDLSASKFPDSGFASPSIDLTVTSDDGKRVEKISIAKSGDGYIAKRENESTLYALDSNAIDGLQKSAEEIKPAAAPTK
jgi:hypothetical protein